MLKPAITIETNLLISVIRDINDYVNTLKDVPKDQKISMFKTLSDAQKELCSDEVINIAGFLFIIRKLNEMKRFSNKKNNIDSVARHKLYAILSTTQKKAIIFHINERAQKDATIAEELSQTIEAQKKEDLAQFSSEEELEKTQPLDELSAEELDTTQPFDEIIETTMTCEEDSCTENKESEEPEFSVSSPVLR